jgi:hypothetical protein
MGFFELGTAENMLEKAKHELARLETERSIDHVYNFFVTAYHIVDYLDGRLPKAAVDAIRHDPLIRLCGDACDKAKSCEIDAPASRCGYAFIFKQIWRRAIQHGGFRLAR